MKIPTPEQLTKIATWLGDHYVFNGEWIHSRDNEGWPYRLSDAELFKIIDEKLVAAGRYPQLSTLDDGLRLYSVDTGFLRWGGSNATIAALNALSHMLGA